jgi:hypothetical protein
MTARLLYGQALEHVARRLRVALLGKDDALEKARLRILRIGCEQLVYLNQRLLVLSCLEQCSRVVQSGEPCRWRRQPQCA